MIDLDWIKSVNESMKLINERIWLKLGAIEPARLQGDVEHAGQLSAPALQETSCVFFGHEQRQPPAATGPKLHQTQTGILFGRQFRQRIGDVSGVDGVGRFRSLRHQFSL